MECVVLATAATRKALAIAKSIKMILRWRVVALFHRKHPYLYSRVFDKRLLSLYDRESARWAVAALEAAVGEGCRVVLPTDYVDFVTFSRYKRLFEKHDIVVATPSYEALKVVSDKRLLPKLLSGIAKTPKQVVVSRSVVEDDIGCLEPPVVVKGVGDASNPKYYLEVEEALEDALSRGDAVVQEFIPGVGRGYYALAYHGEPLLEFTHQRLVEYEPIGGASLAAKGPVNDEKLLELGRRVVKKLEWTGVIMVETRYARDEDEYYVLEINPKFWGSIDLAVECSYHFPALAVALYIMGPDEVERLASRLKPGNRCLYSWFLDGLRYLPKEPKTVIKLAKLALSYGGDIDVVDAPRVHAQLLAALQRLGRERRRFISRLSDGMKSTRSWTKRFVKSLLECKVIVLDLDGTLVRLPVDWNLVLKELHRLGAPRLNSVMEIGFRLWNNDRHLYAKLEKVITEFELEAVKRLELLVDVELLKKLKERGFTMILATRQSREAALQALKKAGLHHIISQVITRSDVGPSKRAMLSKVKCKPAIVVDDDFEVIVYAWRLGHTPLHASHNRYNMLKALTLGIPSANTNQLLNLVLQAIERVEDSFGEASSHPNP